MTPLREVLLAAIAAKLAEALPDITIERARRAALPISDISLPHLNLVSSDWTADDEQEWGQTHYTLGFTVVGTAVAATDLGLEQALSALHAQTVAAIVAQPLGLDCADSVREVAAEFAAYDAADSREAAGEFAASFTLRATAPTGNPYVGS